MSPQPYVSDDERRRYEAVAEHLTDDERAKVERLRVDYEEKQRPNGYGHDLIAAIARGHRRRSEELVLAAMDHEIRGANYGRGDGLAAEPERAWLAFTLVVGDAIKVAARLGVPAEEFRRILQRELDCKDSTSIEKTVERAVNDRSRL